MCTRLEIEDIIRKNLNEHELKDIQRYLQFEDKLDKVLVSVRDSVPPYLSPFLKEMKEDFTDLDGRVEKTEKVITYHTGVMVGIGSAIGIAWMVLGEWLKNKFLN